MAKVEIALAADAIAYLPVHALQLQPPVDVPHGWTWEQCFDVHSRSPGTQNDRGDKACIEYLLQATREGRNAIGVCDPFALFSVEGATDSLCIISGFIAKPCFWIMSDLLNVHDIQNVSPATIIAHNKEFQTGQALAHTVYKHLSWNGEFVYGSFGDIADAAAGLRSKGTHENEICAVSASILNIVLTQSRENSWKVYRLFDIPGFQHSLTTAFIAPKSINLDIEFSELSSYYLSKVFSKVSLYRQFPFTMPLDIFETSRQRGRFLSEKGKVGTSINPSTFPA